VFDWAWAEAHERHGVAYYPKLLSAIPFTPVAGPRLMAVDDAARTALVEVLVATQGATEVSSTHVLFPPEEQARQLQDAGFMLRSGVQFHWLNQGYKTFEEFLATLEQKNARTSAPSAARCAKPGSRCGACAAPRRWTRTGASSTAATAIPTPSTARRPT
jgi:predicted N-acyltransferase